MIHSACLDMPMSCINQKNPPGPINDAPLPGAIRARRLLLIQRQGRKGDTPRGARFPLQLGRSGLCPMSLCGSSVTLILVPLLNSTSVWSSTLSIFVTNNTFM
jgi:hypothetical protein